MAAALEHIRVLDLSRILAGPWASQILGDLGAEVIKIERPLSGDDTRSWGPPYVQNESGEETPDAAYFLCCNRNKESVAIDLTNTKGQSLIREMVKNSDVLIENFKVNGLKQYGLDYTSLRQINPRLIYCSITGFGQTGPYAERAGYDFLIQGLSGLMSVTGRSDDEAGAGPVKVGVALTDILTGLYASTAILAALAHRDVSGEGQYIDLSLMDVQVACMANQAMNYLVSGNTPQRLGNAHPNVVPYQDFPTADGYMILAIGNDSQFARFSSTVGRPEWATDVRYAKNSARVTNRSELIAMISELTPQRTTAEWISIFEAVGVPCGPINDLAGVFEDPQVKARKLKLDLPHAVAGKVPTVANPIRMSATPVDYRAAPPVLGQHTREVLARVLSMDSETLDGLIASKVIATSTEAEPATEPQ